MKKYTPEEAQQLITRAFSPDVVLLCERHMYTPGKSAPKHRCPDCWYAFYMHDIASTPEPKRQERLEQLTELIHHMVELVQQNKWDYSPFAQAKIEKIDKDAA